jgi:arginine decarboxylase
MGAYQDIMGDAHNLFGRPNEVHVYADPDEPEGFYIEKLIPATSVGQMLEFVQYFAEDLRRRMEKIVRSKVRDGVIRKREGVDLLESYSRFFSTSTYLEDTLGS